MMEIWRAGGSIMTSAETAKAVEAEGWDGQMFMDSQCLAADPYVMMGVWAASTERIKLCTGVTNPLTRHLAVTAASAATVQAISNGRAVLGIGRGDSALAYLGHAPAGLAIFEKALEDLQLLLSGREIAFDNRPIDGASSLDTLSLGHRPAALSLQWLPPAMPKVPLDVAATGPKVIAMAAPIAERVTFSVGAVPDRIGWALDIARAARAGRGLTDGDMSYGAQIIVVCHTDAETALEVATSYVPALARFQVIQGKAAGPQSAADEENFATIRAGYDMTMHSKVNAPKRLTEGSLTPEFVRRFAIVGPPDHCIERLLDLVRCGLDRFVIVGPGFYPECWGEARNLFAREVMPVVQRSARDQVSPAFVS